MRSKEFDKIIEHEGACIGYMRGTSRVLFIKTGQGGSIYGYGDRYLDLALTVKESYGFSVFVSATEEDTRQSFERDISIIEEELGTPDFEIFYLGVSKGGLIGIWYGCDESRIVSLVSVNAPLMINYYKSTLPAIKKMERKKLTMIYGSLDPSYNYVPFASKYVDVRIVEGADHNFTGVPDAFFKIVRESLFD